MTTATATQQDDTGVIDAEFTIVETPKPADKLIVFTVTDSQIAELKQRAALVDFSTKEGYAEGVKVIAVSRGGRGEIKRTIAALNEDAKTWIAKVKAEGERREQSLSAIEEPLKLRKQVVDEAKEKAKQAAEAARVAENLRRCECFKELEYQINPFLVESMTAEEYNAELELASIAFKEVLEKRAQAAAEAEAARLQAIADEAARVEALRVEREAIESERAKLEAEKVAHAEAMRKTEEANAAILAKMQADIAEAQRVEAEALAKREADHAEANRLQEESLKAERDKLQAHWDKVAQDERDKAAAEAAKVQADADERQRIEDEAKAEALRVEQEAAEALRLEALKPDIQKIRAFGDMLRLLNYPVCTSTEAQAFIRSVKGLIDNEAEACEEFAS